MIGRPLISSCSLPNAISEPANETDPINAESTVETPRSTPTFPCAAQTPWNSTSETSAAAPPPTPLNSATICGIAVIFTLRAPTSPITAPIAAPAAIHHQPVVTSFLNSVTTIATSIPAAPIWLPSRACLGDERNFSARMNDAIGNEIKQVRGVLAHEGSRRFLNISSIRSVTTKPPTTFAVASTTAMKQTIFMNRPGWARR